MVVLSLTGILTLAKSLQSLDQIVASAEWKLLLKLQWLNVLKMLFIANSLDNFLVQEFLLIIRYDHGNNFSYREKKKKRLGEEENKEI